MPGWGYEIGRSTIPRQSYMRQMMYGRLQVLKLCIDAIRCHGIVYSDEDELNVWLRHFHTHFRYILKKQKRSEHNLILNIYIPKYFHS